MSSHKLFYELRAEMAKTKKEIEDIKRRLLEHEGYLRGLESALHFADKKSPESEPKQDVSEEKL